MTTRALVLGGGTTGIAWEVGVLVGLLERGVSLAADAVIGTSAGAFVGVAVASGRDLAPMFVAQHETGDEERTVTVPRSLFLGWVAAYLLGARDPNRINARFGAIAARRRLIVGVEERQRVVRQHIVTETWPPALRVVAVDAGTGRSRLFSAADGYPLQDVVSASGAVPGVSPSVTLGETQWIDGGMVSSANARFATGFDEVLVIAPLPRGRGGVPSVADEVRALSRTSGVRLIVPDEASRVAVGRNIYDVA